MCLGWAARDRQQLEQKAPLVYIVKIYCVVRFNNGYRADRQLSGGMCTEGEDEREREREREVHSGHSPQPRPQVSHVFIFPLPEVDLSRCNRNLKRVLVQSTHLYMRPQLLL